MPFPSASAGPKEVRAYIAHLLKTKHDVDDDLAAELANRWPMGRGGDFRDASWQQFNKVFGEAVGPFLYRTVRNEESEEWKHTTVGIAHYCKIITPFPYIAPPFELMSNFLFNYIRYLDRLGGSRYVFPSTRGQHGVSGEHHP